MKHQFLLVPATLLLFALATGSSESSADKFRVMKVDGLPVTASLEKPTSKQQADWPVDIIDLNTKAVAVSKDTSIHDLLRANHIFPDVEAFSVVYTLNPEIKKLSDLSVEKIVVPQVRNDESLQPLFKEGYFVYLTIYKEEKLEFINKVEQFGSLAARTLDFGPARFSDQVSQTAIVDSLKGTRVILNAMNKRIDQRFGPPITRSALNQLNWDLESLNELLNKKVSTGDRFEEDDRKLILAVGNDVRIKGRMFHETAAGGAPDAWDGLVTVSVQVLDQKQQEVTGLRIYYVQEAWKNRRDKWLPFSKLTPASEQLEEADYYFWAARVADPMRAPITEEIPKAIRKNKEANIQLVVIR